MAPKSRKIVKQCSLCKKLDKKDMIQCAGVCKEFYHSKCVGIIGLISEEQLNSWYCDKCTPALQSKESHLDDSKHSKIQSREKVGATSVKSHTSKVSNRSINKKMRLLELEQENIRRQLELVDLMSDDEDSRDGDFEEVDVERTEGNCHEMSPLGHYSNSKLQQPSNRPQVFPTKLQLAARSSMSKDLPIFSGRPEEWPIFISAFETSTNVCGLNDYENLIRLQKCLKGKAKELVACQLTLPGQVPHIINTLRMIFGRPEQIIFAQKEKIRNLKPVKIEKLETIVEFSTAVANLYTVLMSIGMEEDEKDRTLLMELVAKLPNGMKLEWAKHKQLFPNPGIKIFQQWINTIAINACSVDTIFDFNSIGVDSTQGKPKKQGRLNFHDTNDTPKNKTNMCLVCNGTCKQVKDCKKFIELSINDKWSLIRNLKLCRQCLKAHKIKYPYNCYNREICNKNDCKRKHHPLLHAEERNPEVNVADEAICNHISDKIEVTFRYLPVTLCNGDHMVSAIAFLDEGSSRTLLEEDFARKLNLKGPETTLCLKWTGTMHRTELNSMSLTLGIIGQYNGARKHMINAVQTVKKLDLPTQTINYEEMAERYLHLKNLPVKSYMNAKPCILIGLKNWNLAVPLRIREGEKNQPIAAKCRLGWTIFAATGEEFKDQENYCNFHGCERSKHPGDELHALIKDFFAVDSMGVKIPPFNTASKEEQYAIKTMENTTKNIGSRYETGLLFNGNIDRMRIPDSKPLAYKRLIGLERRLDRDLKLKRAIEEQMSKYVEQGYIRKLSHEELLNKNKRIWYLPIFPVINPNKPGKVRLVWDAAAQVDGISLNSMLLKGPDLMAPLLDNQLRFRQRKIGICGDIREMFHRVCIRQEDQNMQRFLWRNCDISKEPETYLMQVMTFGATCSPCSAQYVKNLNAKRFEDDFPVAAHAIIQNHYVDDYLDSFDTEEEAITLARQVKYIHSQGGFEIRGWKSNSQRVIDIIEDNHINTDKVVNMEINPMLMKAPVEKVLGMWWILETDEFTYSLKFNKGNKEVLSGKRRPTKREVTCILMSVYDPLGLIAHYLNRLKIILQEIWRTKIEWDEPIEDEQFEKWLQWVHVLPQVEEIRIPRCYIENFSNWHDSEVQLHVFVDGGKDGSAAVAYLRIKIKDEIHCALIGAKTKVAPIKLLSVPKLELVAAQIGARFGKHIIKSLTISIDKDTYWTDSKVVLNWIQSDAKRIKGQFIAFRVAEVQDLTKIKNWRYCPSKLNVADDATKSDKPLSFNTNDRWFKGPKFLYENEVDWPEDLTTTNQIKIREVTTLVHQEIVNLIDIDRFSKWKRLLRTVAYVYKFCETLLIRTNQNNKLHGNLLTCKQLEKAENLLYKIAQMDYYSKEIRELSNTENHQRVNVEKSSSLYSWSPYLDTNLVLRVKGRIDAATCVHDDVKRPIILPGNHPITNLLIQHYHEKFHHINHETVCNEIRQRYAIPRLRQVLQKIRKKCQDCKNNNARPIPPEMGSLPEARLAAFTKPFTYTGVDYFGPINATVNRRTCKRYGCLFTCLTSRAVHIEVAHGLDTDSFILCYRNFINRRGQVNAMYSDCGTNFIGAERILKQDLKSINKLEIAKEFINSELEWHFNPPASPHMGGCWERLVRSVKTALYAISPSRSFSDQVLQSYLIEIENMINSRPLTYLPIDSETSEALTPNHFLLGSSSGTKPIGRFSDDVKIMKQNYLMSQLYARQFWKRFVVEYMPTLTRRLKWCEPAEPLKEGDIVLIVDKDSPRNCCWPKGRIIEVHKGKDNQIRSATVQLSTGIYKRPTVKLAKLDLSGT